MGGVTLLACLNPDAFFKKRINNMNTITYKMFSCNELQKKTWVDI